jgi:cytochrome c553
MKLIPIIAITLSLSAAASFAAPASENWENSCAKCHGAAGKGDTKIGKKLKLKDYSDAKSLADVKDEALCAAITDGVKKDGKEVMKGFKDDFKADEIKELVAHVRGFSKK